MKPSVLIVDDQSVHLEVLHQQIEELGYTIAATHQSAEETLSWVQHGGKADFGLIDLNLPGISGLKLIRLLSTQLPSLYLLAFTAFDDTPTVIKALSAGARGYLLKTSCPQQIKDALQGNPIIATDAIKRMVEHFNQEGLNEPSSWAEETLTPRETDVLALLVRGLSYTEIGTALNIQLGTVQTHVKSIYTKLNVTTKAEATAVALSRKLVPHWVK